ncbi:MULTISPECIES: TetR-like C-terminal domain-containing protein [unclassified Mesorhizobium]|uniref:TetR-like C-terminal domain-containing protein n=1 Tax=unclassified Mesorhizobium TaxID=325217 RepID=UPI00333BA9A7
MRAELAANKDRKLPDVVPNELIVQFVVGAFLSVLIWWLDGGAKLPPQQVDQIFRRLATEGVPSA